MSDLTLFEKLSDVWQKVRTISRVAVGVFPGGDFAFGTEVVRGVPLRVWKSLPPALGTWFRVWFQRHAARDWLVYQGERITYGEGHRFFEALGAELFENPHFNVRRGDRVGIAMRNYPEFLIAFIAVTAAGGVAVPLNSLWGTAELEYAVTDANCVVLIADAERLELCLPFQAKVGFRAIMVRGDVASVPAAVASGAVAWADALANGARRVHVNPRGIEQRIAEVSAEDEAMVMCVVTTIEYRTRVRSAEHAGNCHCCHLAPPHLPASSSFPPLPSLRNTHASAHSHGRDANAVAILMPMPMPMPTLPPAPLPPPLPPPLLLPLPPLPPPPPSTTTTTT
jgi:hypothetical protein